MKELESLKISPEVKNILFNSNDKDLGILIDMFYLVANLFVYSHFLRIIINGGSFDIKNYAQYFICESCIKNLAIGLGVLFDREENSGKETGCRFLNSTFDEADKNNIFNENSSIKFILFQNKKGEVYEVYTKKLEIFRNKRYAHLDSDFHKLFDDSKVVKDDFDKIAELCGTIQSLCESIFNFNSNQRIVCDGLKNSRELLELYNSAGNISYE
ncbi:hypothetical protein [Francisella philomiragia]|uniref:hypothetical protein n=1 Tax=Francisella philomiragia TaxID=28110 RepID=UPI001B8AF330|nr:hypothetical protein [Francisella philomiragia]QUE30705.1 hypothetical protein IMS64_05560 [Francisella philomiragia]